jgi:uncharacterized protein YcaQ
VVDLVDRLTLLQIDPTAAVAPNADLVAWSRLGAAYDPADLTRALEQDRTLFELRAFIRPMTAVALHVPEQTGYTAQSTVVEWIEANDRFRRDIIAQLRDDGPLLVGAPGVPQERLRLSVVAFRILNHPSNLPAASRTGHKKRLADHF